MLPKIEKIKERRESLQISQKEFAKKCGIKASLLNMIERGPTNPSYETWIKIENCLDIEEAKAKGNLKTADDICISSFKSVRQSDSINDAVRLMKKYDYSQLPVMSGLECIGLITDRSILSFKAKGGSTESAKVKDAMEISSLKIDEKTPITPQLLELLSTSSCILVSHQNKAYGIITKIDAIKGRIK